MFRVKVIDQETIKSVLTMKEVIDAVEEVYRMKAQGKTELFPMVTHDFELGISDFDIKSGHIAGLGIYGMKTVSYFSKNAEKGMPNLIGVLTIYDANTGIPIGIMDATYITCMRTGAAGAIGAKHLARKDATKALIIGAGKQAVFQIAALLTACSGIEEIKIYDGLAYANAVEVAETISAVLRDEFSIETKERVRFVAVEDVQTATEDSHIIITVTPSRTPIIKNEWVQPGTHFSCVGSDTQGKQEIDEQIMGRAQIFVDDIKQCVRVGEIEKAILQNIICQGDISGEMGSLLNNDISGRIDEQAITVYDTTGIALQDLVTAKLVLDKIKDTEAGTIVTI